MKWDDFFEFQAKTRDEVLAKLREKDEKVQWRSRTGDQHWSWTYILWGPVIGTYLLYIDTGEIILAKKEEI